jgi:hypothetical protein
MAAPFCILISVAQGFQFNQCLLFSVGCEAISLWFFFSSWFRLAFL